MKNLLLLLACVFVLASPVLAQNALDQNNSEYEKFLKNACESFLESSKKVNEEYKIGSFSRWDFTQDTRQIVFSDKGVVKLIADVQIAGSWAANNTWMWSWNNASLDEALKKDVAKVREFGKEKKYLELTTPTFSSDPDYAWTLTAAAGYVTKAKTAYRGENGTGYVYFLITDLKWVK